MIGTPIGPIRPMPNARYSSGRSVTGLPSLRMKVMPRAMLSMPKVATNGGIERLATMKPLTTPSMAPANMPALTAASRP